MFPLIKLWLSTFFFLSLSFFFSLTFIKKKVTSPWASVARVGWGPAFPPMSWRLPATDAVSSGAPPCCEPHTWQPDCCKAGLGESRVVSPVICNLFCLNSGFIRPRPCLFKRVSGRPVAPRELLALTPLHGLQVFCVQEAPISLYNIWYWLDLP